jgi:hypothetical protein
MKESTKDRLGFAAFMAIALLIGVNICSGLYSIGVFFASGHIRLNDTRYSVEWAETKQVPRNTFTFDENGMAMVSTSIWGTPVTTSHAHSFKRKSEAQFFARHQTVIEDRHDVRIIRKTCRNWEKSISY